MMVFMLRMLVIHCTITVSKLLHLGFVNTYLTVTEKISNKT